MLEEEKEEEIIIINYHRPLVWLAFLIHWQIFEQEDLPVAGFGFDFFFKL